MKSDLSGAAAVAGTVYAAAKRGADVNVVGVMGMAENMPAEDAIRPGDVLETMSGKTIEVMSTDAEGRLVLADAVTYVQGTFIDEDQPWVHLDIAGVDWLDSGTPTTPKGHAGWGVRFMDGILRDLEAE